MSHPAYNQNLGLLLVLIHSTLLVLTTLQQPREGGSFNKGVRHLEGQEIVSHGIKELAEWWLYQT